MFPGDERFPLPLLGVKKRVSDHPTPCLVCESMGWLYRISKSTTSGTRIELALCNKHAKRVWNMPLLNTVPEYIDALRGNYPSSKPSR